MLKEYGKIILWTQAMLLLCCSSAEAQESPLPDSFIGINQRLGEHIPLDLTFRNEDGESVALRDLSSKPMLLSLVYFTCPGICLPLLDGIGHTVDLGSNDPGEDYQIISISFDPNDTPGVAREKKKSVLSSMKNRVLDDDDWIFLTGDTATIRALTTAAGFHYKERESGYLHSATAIVLSPDGKIVRYLFGVDFLPLDVQLALLEARAGRVGPAIAKAARYCFNYDPEGRKYVFDVTKIGGAVIIASGLAFWGTLVFARKKDSKVNEEPKG